ncbi:HWE histidine kinase domain-containing protein [Aureimonas sp. AU40]|uniref:HWE histidine kinase domain-containing protein n=1 Tax=Aureimonas sp. AU40 TaxID=1637747 RepID=UPI000784DE7E|nr:HWE histidine kinase domain-containing protein [Aureimonas sp. AU40]
MLDATKRRLRSDRVAALRRSGLLDRSGEEQFGHLTTHVRDVLNVPVAIITLVDEDRQVFAGHSGLPSPWAERGETPMTHSFCQHVVDRSAPLVVEDARLDPMLKDNMAISDIGVVAYLGVPLALPDGEVVGALAAIDGSPRAWTEDDMRRLLSISRTVGKEMAVRISESRWRNLFESLQEGFVLGHLVRDEAGEVVDWRYEEVNTAWYHLVGIAPGTAVGRTVREVLPGIEEAWVTDFAEVVETGIPKRFTRQVGSSERWYEGLAQSIGADRFTVIFIEVTDRLQREKRQSALLRLGDDLRNTMELDAIMEAAGRCILEGLSSDRVGFGSVNQRAETVDIARDWCAPGLPSIAGMHQFRDFGSFIENLTRGETVAIPDVREDPRTRDEAEAFNGLNICALLNQPIVENGQFVLVVFAHRATAHEWTEEEVRFARQVGDRTQSAIARLRAEEGQRTLNHELAHRMKNSLAMVQAIATQTLRQSTTMEEGRKAISHRLSALARAQDILTRSHFTEADVREVVETAIAPHQTAGVGVSWSGPRHGLTAQQALGLSLAVHELATNATKYGALSNDAGRVVMSWGPIDGAFEFHWIEAGGPAVVPPDNRGFGSRLIERIVASYFDGEGRIDFDPAGIRFKLRGAASGAPSASR